MNFFRDLKLPHTFLELTASRSLEIDQYNLEMKYSALNVDVNSANVAPVRTRSPPYECIKFGYPLQNARFLLLSTNLAREWLQTDTDLLTSFPWVQTSMTLNELEPPKIGVLVTFGYFRLRRTLR